MDFAVDVNLTMLAAQQSVLKCFQSSQAPIVMLAPAPVVGRIASALHGRVAETQTKEMMPLLDASVMDHGTVAREPMATTSAAGRLYLEISV